MSQPFHTPTILILTIFIIFSGECNLWSSSALKCPDHLWGPPSLLPKRHRGFFFGWERGGVKRLGREVYHWPPTCAKVKNNWSYTTTPAIRLQVVDRDDFCYIHYASMLTSYTYPTLPRGNLVTYSSGLYFLPAQLPLSSTEASISLYHSGRWLSATSFPASH
jgi:hypothetical protein